MPIRVPLLLGGLGMALLAVLLWAGYRLSLPRPEPEISAPAPSGSAPAAGVPPLVPGFPGAPSRWRGSAAAPLGPRRGRRAPVSVTTGLVLRSPVAAGGSGRRESGSEERPTAESQQPAESRGGTAERPAAGEPPSSRLGSGNGAAALGGSLGLEDLSPAQSSFGASPSSSPAEGAGG